MKKRTTIGKMISFGAILSLLLVILLCAAKIAESAMQNDGQEEVVTKKTITVDGVAYFPRQDINVLLVMGIDQFGPVESSGYYRNSGASDMVLLLIFDEKNKQCDTLYLNRDTMLHMQVLGLNGDYAGTTYGQLALAHTYGTGLKDSCENTKNTVSDFLGGIHIDYYLAMNMDAIALLNDAVGGVTVNVQDDFSAVDPTIGKGIVTLNGEQAIHFVRTRKDVGDQLNLSRIDRQGVYITAFENALRDKVEQNESFASDVYEEVLPYIVTDCSVNTISGMLNRYADYEMKPLVTPEGRNQLGEEYYEFYVDEEALKALVLELFYAPK